VTLELASEEESRGQNTQDNLASRVPSLVDLAGLGNWSDGLTVPSFYGRDEPVTDAT
jgi:hypothetical protein